MKVFSICEIGVNHLSQYDKAVRMVKLAKEAGANAVKFQKYAPLKLLGKNSPYLNDAHQLSWKELTDLSTLAHSIGLQFGCSVFSVNDIPIVDRIVDFHKIATRMNRNQEFIAKIEATKKPVYMSVQPTVDMHIPDRFKLMWCVPEYPTPKSEVLKYPYSSKFGLSSHCPDWTATYEAVKHGATVIENHVKESEHDLGCDMASSLTLKDYRTLLKALECRQH